MQVPLLLYVLFPKVLFELTEISKAAHRLLMEELGDQYEAFIRDGQVTITGQNGKDYVIHINGYVESYKGRKKKRDGQLFRTGYPAQDALVTLIKFIKYDSAELERRWGCGNISLAGGEIKSD